MSLSANARLLLIGLWTEAFDDGVFEWKPLTIKARIFPVDNVDVPELLIELANACFINRAENHHKQPGLIRNFQRFQRPKKPNSSGLLPDEWREYVGDDGTGTEPVRNQFGTGTGKPPQMEDGGCSKDVDANASTSPEPEKSAPASPSVFDLPCTSGESFPVTEADVSEWCEAFPAVDVRQQLAAMRAWLHANPKRAKTRRGMKRFAVSWLDRQQNKAPAPRAASPPPRQTVGQQARDELRRMGFSNVTDTETRYRDESDGSSDIAGSGIARRVAFAAGGR